MKTDSATQATRSGMFRWLLTRFRLEGPLPLRREPVTFENSQQHCDRLFDKLANTRVRRRAIHITKQIWTIWLISPNEEAQSLLDNGMFARRAYRFNCAESSLRCLTEIWPDYAEGWNQLATLNYYKGDFRSSLREIDRVLELESRHFGAFAGLMAIHKSMGRRDKLEEVRSHLAEFHPFPDQVEGLPPPVQWDRQPAESQPCGPLHNFRSRTE